MLENIGKFLSESWRAPFEIGILATVLYYIYLYLRGTHGARILIGLALVFLTLTFISQIFDLAVISWILSRLSVFLAVALVVIFQPELRRALTDLGSHPFFTSAFEKRETIEDITDTVFEIASKGFGALIAIEREIELKPFIETGVGIDADYSKELALTIFHPKTVLHDGGLIVRNDRIVAAACIFPLTQREDLDRNLGLRHRAALGLSEESDALAIVVSEETGQVSICHSGILERNLSVEKFRRRLSQLLLHHDHQTDPDQQLGSEAHVPDSRGRPVVPHQPERGEKSVAA
ncbi:MAG TPA: diadenylate cyclase CdaA [Terrimicrobiaceae bacterium]|nr:diadenylate cyclase CdaA [Terrimicrobiaceae bacterium]